MAKLSQRLQLICDFLIAETDVWDLCCDHGLVGFYCYKSRKFRKVYFVDRVQEIIKRTQWRFVNYVKDNSNLTETDFIVADMKKLGRTIEGNVIIAGIGALNIIEALTILHEAQSLKAERLILAPQNGTETFNEKMLEKLGTFYFFQESHRLLEKGRERTIFIYNQKIKEPSV